MKKRTAYRNTIFILTAVSFAVILCLTAFFAVYAPGHYDLEGSKSALDILYAVALLISNVLIFLSLIEFFKACSAMFREKNFSVKQCGAALLGIYPVILVLFLCGWNFSVLGNYLLSPLNILFA